MRPGAAALIAAAAIIAAACGEAQPHYHNNDDATPTTITETTTHTRGISTWYAARCAPGVVYLDRTDTCWPYRTKKDGGRGGERKFYGAVGTWRYTDEAYELDVVFLETGRTVRIWVRDYCQACAEGRVLIDLSPLTVLAGGLTLGQGRYRIELREVPADK